MDDPELLASIRKAGQNDQFFAALVRTKDQPVFRPMAPGNRSFKGIAAEIDTISHTFSLFI